MMCLSENCTNKANVNSNYCWAHQPKAASIDDDWGMSVLMFLFWGLCFYGGWTMGVVLAMMAGYTYK